VSSNLIKSDRLIIFDTTMRDGELSPGIQMSVEQKICLAQMLEKMGVDVIEVSYPARSPKDLHELFTISKFINNSTICGLASSKESEILKVAEGIQLAAKGRIHIYTNVNLKSTDRLTQAETLTTIKSSISLARNYCEDIEWSAFDATKSDLDFLCRTIEIAIATGATTINIPDTLGMATPAEFSQLIKSILERVPNINKSVVSVHCHDDLNMAVENSLAAVNCGAKQIECSLRGLGARKGNADFVEVVNQLLAQKKHQINIDIALMPKALELVDRIIEEKNERV
jgi:2-isopropylmalate synthase